MLANYHTHTPRCGHATGSECQYIERAIEEGFKVLGFSDHTPQPYPRGFVSHIRMSLSQLPEYVNTLQALKKEYEKKIKILIGFEAEYSRAYFPLLIKELKKFPVDYIIQGQHFVPDEVTGFYAGEETENEEDLSSYVDLTIEGMQTGLFSYLAHPDLINYIGKEEIFCKHMSRLVEASIKCKVPLEVNMLGFISGRHYPTSTFFKLAAKMGASFIIGCDAHKPGAIRQAERDPAFMAFLADCGISVGDNLLSSRFSVFKAD